MQTAQFHQPKPQPACFHPPLPSGEDEDLSGARGLDLGGVQRIPEDALGGEAMGRLGGHEQRKRAEPGDVSFSGLQVNLRFSECW